MPGQPGLEFRHKKLPLEDFQGFLLCPARDDDRRSSTRGKRHRRRIAQKCSTRNPVVLVLLQYRSPRTFQIENKVVIGNAVTARPSLSIDRGSGLTDGTGVRTGAYFVPVQHPDTTDALQRADLMRINARARGEHYARLRRWCLACGAGCRGQDARGAPICIRKSWFRWTCVTPRN